MLFFKILLCMLCVCASIYFSYRIFLKPIDLSAGQRFIVFALSLLVWVIVVVLPLIIEDSVRSGNTQAVFFSHILFAFLLIPVIGPFSLIFGLWALVKLLWRSLPWTFIVFTALFFGVSGWPLGVLFFMGIFQDGLFLGFFFVSLYTLVFFVLACLYEDFRYKRKYPACSNQQESNSIYTRRY